MGLCSANANTEIIQLALFFYCPSESTIKINICYS